MDCIAVMEARYVGEYRIYLKFNTGETGEADLRELVHKYSVAEPLRDPAVFARFHLDSWPTVVWDCGFDVAPESLSFLATGKNEIHNKSALQPEQPVATG